MLEWTVAEMLDRRPGSAAVFVQLRTACVGCVLARFCTIADVGATYGIPLGELIRALEAAGSESEPGEERDELDENASGANVERV